MARRRGMELRVGVAGWSIPRAFHDRFPADGSHLARYAARLGCVEINSSFYRPHRRATYERWAGTVPGDFRFAVKVPKTITHEHRLVGCTALLERFLDEVAGLGGKLGPLLVQLPGSFACAIREADAFLGALRERFAGAVVLEPRHPSWFSAAVAGLLRTHRVARVAADPARVPDAAEPGGWDGVVYHRLHGSPEIYRSPYDEAALEAIAARLAATDAAQAWCIFDNTTFGAATANALWMTERLDGRTA
jgi:uncharacterized protein YecE (DUF72 family)